MHVGGVALGPVGDKDLVGCHLRALAAVAGRDGVEQEIVALLGTVAAKGLFVRHLVGGSLDRVDDGRGQGQHHIADAQTDDARCRVRRRIGPHPLANLGEEVASLQFLVVRVDLGHRFDFLSGCEAVRLANFPPEAQWYANT